MLSIENNYLRVTVNPKGAELSSIYNKQEQLEYLWSADPLFWAKKSPVLFPIVGTLKNDTYFFGDKSFHMGRHGFAREMTFIPTSINAQSITLILQSDEGTLKSFPFQFMFEITYTIQDNSLQVTYKVTNNGEEDMYFSVGGHPAFKLPLTSTTAYEDYFLQFNTAETVSRWPISDKGLIEKVSVPFLEEEIRIYLKKELFYKDAIVLKNLHSSSVTLASGKTSHGVSFDFTGFPFLGIWAAKDANFVCIEPWCGIADSVDTNQQLMEKEGINQLEPGKIFSRTWGVSLF